MLVILPPSETKRTGGDDTFDPTSLSHDTALANARTQVREALRDLCQHDKEQAIRALKLGVNNRGEIHRNLELASSGAMPAANRYTGVLYDALNINTLQHAARDWVNTHVAVQSALFGLISAADLIPAYRLSASTRLPALVTPLTHVWAEAHRNIDYSNTGLILDLRSKEYARLADVPQAVRVNVVTQQPNGVTKTLTHFNKAAKGDLVRRLAQAGEHPGNVHELLHLLNRLGVHSYPGTSEHELILVTQLGGPHRTPQTNNR